MLVEQAKLDVTSNNLANVNTAGFKQDRVVTESFSGLLLHALDGASPMGVRRNRLVGELGTGANEVRSFSDLAPGALRHTGNALDVALLGEGFFAVDTPQGQRYTRNGSFTVNEEAILVNGSGHPVLGVNGPISIRGTQVDIDTDGTVFVDNEPAGQLQIVSFANSDGLVKESGQYFRALEAAGQPTVAAGVTVSQGDLEQSNVNTISAMVNMINATRSYEVSQKAIQAQDETLGKAVNEVGRMA